MGSTTSRQASTPSSFSSSSRPTALPPSSNRRPSNTLARLNSLRRLSTLGRRDSSTSNGGIVNSSGNGNGNGNTMMSSKRGRQGSSTSNSPLAQGEEKKNKKRHRGISPAALAEVSPLNRVTESPSSAPLASPLIDTGSAPAKVASQAILDSPLIASRAPSPPTIIESAHEDMETDHTPPRSITPYPQPSTAVPTLSLSPPSPIHHEIATSIASSIPLPVTPTPRSESSDPLEAERRQSISAIRDALGSDWPNDASSSSSHDESLERLLNRFRRTSSYPDLSEQAETPSQQPTMPDRLTALLGFSTPVEHEHDRPSPSSSSPSNARASASDPSSSLTPLPGDEEGDNDENIEDLERRIEEVREELAQARRNVRVAQERVDAAQERLDAERAGRRQQGAVLVIQGLAQTHTAPDEEETATSTQPQGSGGLAGRMGGGFLRPGIRARRSSEGSTSTRRRMREEEERRTSSLETQARMIGGLLTVAAAATATTLLAPDSTPQPSSPERSTAASALESLVNRLRPSRPNRSQSVEAALSSYLRTVLNGPDNQADQTSNVESIPAEAANAHISDGFQRFLEGLQGDLVTAVRDFAGPLPVSPAREEEEEVGETESFVTATEGVLTPLPSTPILGGQAAYPQPGQSSAESAAGSSTPQTGSAVSAVPSFHRQLGQNLSTSSGRNAGRPVPEVTGGDNGTPRRLNFFRAHMFPSNPPETGTEGEVEAPDAMVPCIFIGVRSIRHDPSMTTEDLVQHPSFPFVDGQVPSNEPPPSRTSPLPSADTTSPAPMETENDDPLNPSTPFAMPSIIPSAPAPSTLDSTTASATAAPERRSLRERFLDRLNPQRNASRPTGPLNTYLVYVIGGNYPRNHPVLSIPSLITGGPLTDEELALVSELMGQAKPPTVQKEDIERSGLKVVKGGEMEAENEKGSLLDVCADKCLICLSEYEPEEDCRILNCRHGYHQECVDHWLSTGRNSCPACRSEAVDTSKISSAAATATATTATTTTIHNDE
ncbi:hypothetical protein I317_05181 [Kwoniella heveanensis CBS 569]|nr:hypothetical protein I317_05181 [Kwoniella heveanensis CBS 569]